MLHRSRNPLVRGFSLPEMLVVIFVVSIVGLAISSMILYFYRSNADLIERTRAVEIGRRGLDLSFRNLRQASYGADGSYPIESLGTSTLTFYGDTDGDSSVERVRLYLEDGMLYSGTSLPAGAPLSYAGQDEAVRVVARSIANGTSTPLFRYFDQDDAELLAPVPVARVRSIETTLVVDTDAARGPATLMLRATAMLRNLRAD